MSVFTLIISLPIIYIMLYTPVLKACDIDVNQSARFPNYKSWIFSQQPSEERVYCEGIVTRNNSITHPGAEVIGYRSSQYSYAMSEPYASMSFVGVQNQQVHSVIIGKPDHVYYRRDEKIKKYTGPIDLRLNILKHKDLRFQADSLLSLACTPSCDDKDAKFVATQLGKNRSNKEGDLYLHLALPRRSKHISITLADYQDRTADKDKIIDRDIRVGHTGTKEFKIKPFKGIKRIEIKVELDDDVIDTSALIVGYDTNIQTH